MLQRVFVFTVGFSDNTVAEAFLSGAFMNIWGEMDQDSSQFYNVLGNSAVFTDIQRQSVAKEAGGDTAPTYPSHYTPHVNSQADKRSVSKRQVVNAW